MTAPAASLFPCDGALRRFVEKAFDDPDAKHLLAKKR